MLFLNELAQEDVSLRLVEVLYAFLQFESSKSGLENCGGWSNARVWYLILNTDRVNIMNPKYFTTLKQSDFQRSTMHYSPQSDYFDQNCKKKP